MEDRLHTKSGFAASTGVMRRKIAVCLLPVEGVHGCPSSSWIQFYQIDVYLAKVYHQIISEGGYFTSNPNVVG